MAHTIGTKSITQLSLCVLDMIRAKNSRRPHHYRTLGLLSSLVLFATCITSGSSAAAGAVTTPFLKRSGQTLTYNNQPVTLTGFNLWRANITTSQPNTTRPINATGEMAASMKTMTGNTVRTWFFQQFATTPTSAGYDWSAFDRTIAEAKVNHKVIIATLVDQWNYDGTTFKDENWYNSGYKNNVLPLQRVTYRQYVADIVAHYKDEPTIAAWELANEPEDFTDASESTCSSTAPQAMVSWANDVAGLIKSIDQNHLVSFGGVGTGTCGTNEGDYQKVMSSSAIDLCTLHDYYGASNPSAYEQWNGLNTRVTQCGALNKPIIIEESGIDASNADRANDIDTRARAQLAQKGVVGYLVWQYDQDPSQASDNYAVGPTDPVLSVVDKLAPVLPQGPLPYIHNPTESVAWSLKFDDEFDNTNTINTKDWSTGWFGSGLTQAINTDDPYCFNSANTTISNGNAHLAFKRQTATCGGQLQRYTGAILSTQGKHEFTYGYFEASLNIPFDAQKNPYNWMTFWLNGANWPNDGEIDITEQNEGLISFNSHYGDGTASTAAYQNGPTYLAGKYEGSHTYGVDWEPTYMKFYYDGYLVGTYTEHITSSPMYILLTYATSKSGLGTSFSVPRTVDVGHVRVWQRN